VTENMSKEDMVKEAVEEAKAKAEAEETNATTAEAEEAAEAEAKEDAEDTAEAGEETGSEEDQGEEKSGEKKKFFGKKNKKDKKDEKIEELNDRITRQMAEFDNFRKRSEKEKSQMYEIGAKDIIEKILPVVDNTGRGKRFSVRRRNGEDLQAAYDDTGFTWSETDQSCRSGV